MGVLSRIRESIAPAATGVTDMVEVLSESVRDLSLQLEDRGWKRLGSDDESTMTREALVQAALDGRALAVAHPLVRRGISLRTSYVQGQGGPALSCEDEEVNAVIQQWWTAPENLASLTGPEARARLERSLSTDGNVFIASFTNPVDGRVTNRTIAMEQISRIISNPEDRAQVMFYERTYSRRRDAFSTVEEQVKVLYPDLAYAPRTRPRIINGMPVQWDQPIRHVRVNELDGWEFGIGDLFSVAPYARGYRDFLNDWLRLMKSLSQFAWRGTAEGKRAQKARQALARAQQGVPGNDGSVGATYVSAPGEGLEAIPKTGATIDADSGRPILAMIAAGLDVPVTMLSTDPGITGARSTAETLDKPMMLAMRARQDVWSRVFIDLAEYRIEQAVRAGKLPGAVVRDPWTDTDHAELNGEQPVIHCDWPDLSTSSVDEAVAAIKDADATGKLPPLVIARLLLTALGVEDIDAVLEELTDDDGNWRDPYAQLGQGLVNAFQRGEDPAALLSQYGRFGTDAAAAEARIRGES